MAHVEIPDFERTKASHCARGVTRIRPGLLRSACQEQPGSTLVAPHITHARPSPDIVSDFRAGTATLIGLFDAAGSRYLASAGATRSVENATDDDPIEAESVS